MEALFTDVADFALINPVEALLFGYGSVELCVDVERDCQVELFAFELLGV